MDVWIKKYIYICVYTYIHTYIHTHTHTGFTGDSVGRRIHLQFRRHRLDPWVRKIPWRRKWQSTPVFLPVKSHWQKSLLGYFAIGLWVKHGLASKPPPSHICIYIYIYTHSHTPTYTHTYIYTIRYQSVIK